MLSHPNRVIEQRLTSRQASHSTTTLDTFLLLDITQLVGKLCVPLQVQHKIN